MDTQTTGQTIDQLDYILQTLWFTGGKVELKKREFTGNLLTSVEVNTIILVISHRP